MASNDDASPTRKHPAHGVLHLPHQPTIIFDTVGTKGRQQWLANDAVHELLRSVWIKATAWLMGRYVDMPDHIHYFAAATESPIDYESWVKYWKSQFSKGHADPSHRWLTDHWDTRMRSHEQYEEKWNYVRHNPVRHGLVAHPDDWPYQGEIYRLDWE
jgi:REP element-mobilizing transposase RayT